MQTKSYPHTLLLYSLIALITIITYWHIYDIPFLYTEVKLMQNPIIQNLMVFFERLYILNWKALLARPLANFTFAVNYAIGGKNPLGYHLVNLIIHLMNVFLVYIIAKKFFKLPWLAMTLFALHPLGTAVVSQVFGRPYSLGTCFMLLGLYVYLSARQQNQLNLKVSVLLAGLFLCMLMSKQTFVFFPFILIWHIWCFPENFFKQRFSLVSGMKYIWPIIIIIGIVIFFATFYAAPMAASAVVDSKIFVISQFGNIHELIGFYFLPFQITMRHDLPFYANWFSPEVIFGMLFLLVYMALTLRLRHSTTGFLMGALLICLLPTNTIFPKDEVILDWRLYPSLVFFCLLMGNMVFNIYTLYSAHWQKYLRVGLLLGSAGLILYLGSFILTIWQQNLIYGSNLSAWQQVFAKYPYSANAANHIGVIYYSQKKYQKALYYFKQAYERNPTNAGYAFNLSRAYRILGQQQLSNKYAQEATRLKQLYGHQKVSIELIQ